MNTDMSQGSDGSALSVTYTASDRAKWSVSWTLEKRHGDPLPGQPLEDFLASVQPYEVRQVDGNILVNTGIALMEDLLIGAGGTVFNNANSYIGVGDSATAATAAQTDLQASTNKARVAMDSTFPSRSGQTVTWRMSAGSGTANFAWNEWGIFNASTAGTMLNRKVEVLGTKAAGTWTLACAVTIS